MAAPNAVSMTESVLRLVAGLFIVQDDGEKQLKGVRQPLHLYSAIQATGVRRRLSAAAIGHEASAFVGRKEELHMLLARWHRTRGGEGQVVCVIGEPGIGKSRLLQQAHDTLGKDLHTWIECGGDPLFQSTPFFAVTEMLHEGYSAVNLTKAGIVEELMRR